MDGKQIYVKNDAGQARRTTECLSCAPRDEVRLILTLDFEYTTGYGVMLKTGKPGNFKHHEMPIESDIGFDFQDCDEVMCKFNRIATNLIDLINHHGVAAEIMSGCGRWA